MDTISQWIELHRRGVFVYMKGCIPIRILETLEVLTLIELCHQLREGRAGSHRHQIGITNFSAAQD